MTEEEAETQAQPARKKRKKPAKVSFLIFTLICLFSMAAWLDMYGVQVEMPILVNILPEGWQLPAYVTIIMKAGNIAPITYLIIQKFCKGNTKVREISMAYGIILLGAICCLLLSVFWNKTLEVDGVSHSVAFFILVSFLSVVDCTSAVVFMPYMARFKPVYMTAYCIGEGMSGLLPGILGLIQGVGPGPVCANLTVTSNVTNGTDGFVTFPPLNDTERGVKSSSILPTNVQLQGREPTFTVEIYFLLLFFLLLLSGAAFTGLNFMPLSKKHKRMQQQPREQGSEEMNTINPHGDGIPGNGYIDDSYIIEDQYEGDDGVSVVESDRESLYYVDNLVYRPSCQDFCGNCSAPSACHFAYLLLLNIGICAAAYGIMPTLLPYACLPYGEMTYGLTLRLCMLAIPLAALITFFVSTSSTKVITLISVLALMLACYPAYLASTSPYPPLQHHTAGTALVVAITVASAGVMSYAYTLIHIQLQSLYGHRGLVWCGATTQFGSFLGAIMVFIPLHYFDMFTAMYPCMDI